MIKVIGMIEDRKETHTRHFVKGFFCENNYDRNEKLIAFLSTNEDSDFRNENDSLTVFNLSNGSLILSHSTIADYKTLEEWAEHYDYVITKFIYPKDEIKMELTL